MDSLELKRRGVNDDAATAETEKKSANDVGKQPGKRKAVAKRGLRSLALAILAPVLITLLTTVLFGSGDGYGMQAKPWWIPPLWALRATCLGSSSLMGLSAWLIWVEGGFHSRPRALSLYLAQILLSLAWEPIAFRVGSGWAGLVVWLCHSAALFGCYKTFKPMNPIAGDLVKPALAWAAFVAAVNLKLTAF